MPTTDPSSTDPSTTTTPTLEELADEFGGLAHWYVVNRLGRYDQDRWDTAIIHLYEQRGELLRVTDQRERGAIALRAFSSNDQNVDRLRQKLAARGTE